EDKTIAEWVKPLGSPDVNTRRAAAFALSRVGPGAADAVPALGAALKERDEAVRYYSAVALGKVGPAAKGAIPALIAALQGPESIVRGAAGTALSGIGKEAVPALAKGGRHKDPQVRRGSVQALAASDRAAH